MGRNCLKKQKNLQLMDGPADGVAGGEPAGEMKGLFMELLSLEEEKTHFVPDDMQVNSLGLTRKVRLAVDSGACMTVVPPSVGRDYPTYENPESRRGATYRSVSGHGLKDEGTRPLACKMADGSTRVIQARVVDTHKGLLSVYEHVENGNSAHFTPQGSYSLDKHGKKTPFEVNNRAFELPMEVLEYSRLGKETQNLLKGLNSGHPFQRQV